MDWVPSTSCLRVIPWTSATRPATFPPQPQWPPPQDQVVLSTLRVKKKPNKQQQNTQKHNTCCNTESVPCCGQTFSSLTGMLHDLVDHTSSAPQGLMPACATRLVCITPICNLTLADRLLQTEYSLVTGKKGKL